MADLQQKQDDEEEDDDDENDSDISKKPKPTASSTTNKIDTTYYDYLINMSLRNLTKERRNEILREQQEKHEKLQALQKKSPEDLYEDDLTHFEAEYHKVTHPFFFGKAIDLMQESRTGELICVPKNLFS